MPEKSKSASFTLYYEQEKLAQLSEDTHDYDDDESCSCDECCGEEEEDLEGNGYEYESEEENYDDDNLPDLGEILGFRITGGSDFFMPITIFHVKENSRAEKGNLKLGDAILSINGRSTAEMTLVQANRYLARVADGDVTLQVAKFNPNYDEDDEVDDSVQAIEEVVLEGPLSLQKKLQLMQQQLLDMTDIPPQIQSKLAQVTKALEQFMMDPEALEASSVEREASHESMTTGDEKQFSTIDDDEVAHEEEANGENFEIEHSTRESRETSYSFEELVYEGSEEENCEFLDDEEQMDETQSNNEEENLTTEEMLKLNEERKKKNEKIQTLQKSWQKLCENQKPIHKRSNCHLVPSTAIINNK